MEEKERNREIIIYSVGKQTQVFVDGKVFGIGITGINFTAKSGEYGKLTANCAVLPIVGDDSEAAVNGFLNIITGICKPRNQNATTTNESSSSTEAKEV